MSRISIIEKDLAGFTNSVIDHKGAAVIKSSKGKNTPMLLQSENDVIQKLGIPSAQYPDVFEILAYVRYAPIWVVSSIGKNALFGGVDILSNNVVPFTIGRNENFTFNAIPTSIVETINTGDGTTTEFTGTLSYFPIVYPQNFKILLDTSEIPLTISETGTITGSYITGSINFTTGAYSLTFATAPGNGVDINCQYIYSADKSSNISHSIMTTSPYKDDLACIVKYISGSQFELQLYRKTQLGYSLIQTYKYSLIQEKDYFGRSLYYMDVFNDDPYVQIKVNTSFVGTYNLNITSQIDFAGGNRGEEPEASDYQACWDYFKYANKYPARLFIDTTGNNAEYIKTIVTQYQTFSFGITIVPLGKTPAQAITYVSELGVSTDKMAIYHNWAKIKDNYNNSFAWVSLIGSVGGKFAQMVDRYLADSPAGINEDGKYGGQLQDWTVVEMENDFTENDLTNYYNAKINPIIFDPVYGVMVYGDQTLSPVWTDTSYIGARRVYDYILEIVSKQILRKQEFKVNDQMHRLMAKVQIDNFIEPIKQSGWIRDYLVVCDETNNNDIALQNREFIVDLYIQIMPNSQWIKLRLTRVGQTININDLIA